MESLFRCETLLCRGENNRKIDVSSHILTLEALFERAIKASKGTATALGVLRVDSCHRLRASDPDPGNHRFAAAGVSKSYFCAFARVANFHELNLLMVGLNNLNFGITDLQKLSNFRNGPEMIQDYPAMVS